MKELLIIGHPVGKYGPEHDHELAHIWQDVQHRVHVTPTRHEFGSFAREVQRLINERLADPKKPIHCMVSTAYTKDDGTVLEADGVHISKPEDHDFLETLNGDMLLWGDWAGPSSIAGYVVRTGASRVIEK